MDKWLELASDQMAYRFSLFGAFLVIFVWIIYFRGKTKAEPLMHDPDARRLRDVGLCACVFFTCFVVLYWLQHLFKVMG